jgi:predicted nucleotidyltransferase
MNIHFTDKELFERLKSATIAKVVVGSNMYGTNTETSDIDYLSIYATSENELLSFIKTHHQLQYKEDGVDYNFVSLHNFLENCLSGDSTINFEVLCSPALIGTELEFLYNHRKSFLTYSVVRSYLGLARRDVKHFYSAKTESDRIKRLKHAIRGYIYARDMIAGDFDFGGCNQELLGVAMDHTSNKQIKEYDIKISFLRNELANKFNGKTLGLPQHIDVTEGIKITEEFLNYCKSNEYKKKRDQLKDFDLSAFINSFENWVEY